MFALYFQPYVLRFGSENTSQDHTKWQSCLNLNIQSFGNRNKS